MHLLIAGGSGFIGQNLINLLTNDHKITILGRDRQRLEQQFEKPIQVCTWDTLSNLDANHYDAIINLCGHNIASSRWNKEIKQKIIDSRVNTTTKLIEWAMQHHAKPHFYCANAVGIYGLQDNADKTAFDEESPIDQPHDFVSEVGIRWQQASQLAIDYGMPVTITRFGVVLQKGEGMLKRLAPTFKLGLGSVIGDGQQVISWVHINDVTRAYAFLLNHPELVGPFNLTSPNPVTQKEFAKTFAKVLHRPLLLKTPAFIIRLLFGEMGESLINRGARVLPKRLPEAGYEFSYPQLEEALKHEFK